MTDTVRNFFNIEADKALAAAQALIKTATDEVRGMTPEENAEVEAYTKQAIEYQQKVEDFDNNEAAAKRIADLTGPVVTKSEEAEAPANSIGTAFVKSAGYQVIKDSGNRTNSWSSGVIEFGEKATVSTTASPIVQTGYTPGIWEIPSQAPTVASLFAQATTNSNVVNYVKETTATNAAAGTSQGALKPESSIVFANATTSVRKIATFLPVTDEMIEDVDQIQSYLDARLSLFVRQAEDTALLSGSGTDPALLGVLNSGIHTANATALVADNPADALYQAITTINDLSYLNADAIVMHPTDWATLRLMKDQNEQYYGGGPFTGAYGGSGGISPNSIWGLPVVVTTAITLNTALVGAFKTAAVLYRKQGLTVEASNSHLDWFQRNMTAIRAETRLALAVIRPTGFFSITNLDDVFS